jgi:branched-chain amino acid aminotransferase
MPVLPEWLFMDGMKKLIDIDRAWVPQTKDSSLYIRPFMFATDCLLGVHPSTAYKFYILLSPSGAYSSSASAMKIRVEQKYTRAAPGGVGFSKNAGNYAGSLIAAQEAQKAGYDQVLWTDPFEHKWLDEVGMMNVFFVLNGKIITPDLDGGTILDGVTRKSAITVLQEEMNREVEERSINIDELVEGFKKGTFTEAFGTGTAAVVSFISRIGYENTVMDFDVAKLTTAIELKQRLDAIRGFTVEDKRGWMVKV